MGQTRLIRAGTHNGGKPTPRWRSRSWTWIALYEHRDGHRTRGHGWTQHAALMSLADRLGG